MMTASVLGLSFSSPSFRGLIVGVQTKSLRYKPEGRGFDSRWCHWIFSLT